MKALAIGLIAAALAANTSAHVCASDVISAETDFWSAPDLDGFTELTGDRQVRANKILNGRRIALVSRAEYQKLTGKNISKGFGYLVLSIRYKAWSGGYMLKLKGTDLLVYFGAMGRPDGCELVPLAVDSPRRINNVFMVAGSAE